MDQREFRSYIGMTHFHPERNVVNGIDVCKNGRFVNQIKNKMGQENVSRTWTNSSSPVDPAHLVAGSASSASQSSSATSVPSFHHWLTSAQRLDMK